jgi:hypothetical protein
MVLAWRRKKNDEQNISGIEAEIDVREQIKGTEQQARADEEHDGKCNFADDQNGAQFPVAKAAVCAFAAGCKLRLHVGAGGMKGWGQAAHYDRKQCDGDREKQYRSIEA